MTASPTIVRVDNLSKRFVLHVDKSIKERVLNFSRSREYRKDFWALKDVNLQIESGSMVGLVGHNGSGKSTLLKAIGGIIQPTSGSVQRRGRLAALIELGAGFHPDLTGRENVYLNAAILGLTRQETSRHFDAIVDFSGIEEFIDTQVKFYSSGMYVRLAFAVAVHVDPDLLLVDEVLAVGDEPFQRKCMEKIADFQHEGRTIVLVSHSIDQVGELCDRVAVLNHGRLVHDGDTAEGLRVLRAGFAAAEEETDAKLRARSDAPALTTRILDVTARTDKLSSSGAFAAGSTISIDVDYAIGSVPPRWIAGINLETPRGQPVYRVNTEGLRMELPTEPGEYTLTFQLPKSALGGGQYLVTAGLVTAEGETIDFRNPGTSFFAQGEAAGVGLVRFDSSATVTRTDLPIG